MSDKEQIIEYLSKAGVNSNIINYISKKNLLISDVKKLLGDSYISGMNIDEQGCIDKLIRGTETFRITSDGNIWFCKEENNQLHESVSVGQTFYTGGIAKSFMPQETMLYDYIENDDNNIRDNQLRIKKHAEKDKEYYDGEIIETLYNSNLEKKEIQSASWFGAENRDIPDKNLETVTEEINEFGFGTRKKEEKNFTDDKWNFIQNGKTVGEKIQEEITEEISRSKITLDSVKNFFHNILSKDKEKEK